MVKREIKITNWPVCNNALRQRSAVWKKFSGQSLSEAQQHWDSTDFVVTPEVLWEQTNKTARNEKVIVRRGDGRLVEMITDGQGRLSQKDSVFIESVQVKRPGEEGSKD